MTNEALDRWTQFAFKEKFDNTPCRQATKYAQVVKCVDPDARETDARFAGLGGCADDARFAGLGGAADDALGSSLAAHAKITERNRLKMIDKEEIDLPILNPINRARLIHARAAKKLTQQQLANLVNMRVQVIQELETGRPVADVGVLRKLMRLLGKQVKLQFGKEAV
jgi:DNA-binding XRE family transcriptional regulator